MEIEEIRKEIDTIDSQLLKLFLERMHLGEAVAACKREHNLPVLNKAREREILARVQTEAGEMWPLGTRFTVHVAEGPRSLVAVYEGAVRLRPRLRPQQERVLPAGQLAWLDTRGVAAAVPAYEEQSAWIDGMLVARNMRLDAVLQALQSASVATLVCHPAVAGLKVSGTYPLDDVPRVMDTLGMLLQLQVRSLRRWWGGQELAIGPAGAL